MIWKGSSLIYFLFPHTQLYKMQILYNWGNRFYSKFVVFRASGPFFTRISLFGMCSLYTRWMLCIRYFDFRFYCPSRLFVCKRCSRCRDKHSTHFARSKHEACLGRKIGAMMLVALRSFLCCATNVLQRVLYTAYYTKFKSYINKASFSLFIK